MSSMRMLLLLVAIDGTIQNSICPHSVGLKTQTTQVHKYWKGIVMSMKPLPLLPYFLVTHRDA